MNDHDDNSNARGSAGGAASTLGARYAGSVGAFCVAQMLMGQGASLQWKLSDRHSIESVACESSTIVDDLVLRLLPEGTVYIQIKHGLKLNAEFNKALAQLILQFWAPGFSCINDRLVIATDSSASGTVRIDVRNVLMICHDLSHHASLSIAANSQSTKGAFERLKERFEAESKRLNKTPKEITQGFREFLGCTHLSVFDTIEGRDEHQSIERLRQVVKPEQALQAWELFNITCLDAATLRKSLDRTAFWNILRRHEIEVSHRRLSVGGLQVQLEDVLRGMTEQRVDQLMALGQFVPDFYVMRSDLDLHLEKFFASSKSLMVISGGSGQGKTCWCAQLGKSPPDRPILLIAAENLEISDASLGASLVRLVERYIREHGGYPLPAVELSQWLHQTKLLVIIDGLDRTPSFSRHLSQWMNATLAQLTQSSLQLILTGRPETIGRLRASLELSPQVYCPQERVWQVQVSDFTKEEARTAANRLGDARLARYRHPSMMSFCAQLEEHGDFALEEAQIVDLFIERRISQVINEYDILDEHLALFIERLSRMLAKSEQGVLIRNEVLEMSGFDKPAYEALRRVNFIVESQGVLRVEPDKISERLHGRFLDAPKVIAELEQIRVYPLKVGALRFALVDLAKQDEDLALDLLRRLVESHQNSPIDITLSLSCSIAQALPDWRLLEPLVAAMGQSYRGTNLGLLFESGRSLLELMISRRWSAEQRVRLLWTLATREWDCDWRNKHWEKYKRVSGFDVSPWRVQMLIALQEAQVGSWRFLIERFDSKEALQGSNEADLGILAQGLFFLSAEAQMWPALQALAMASSKSSVRMLELLARDYSEQVASLMGDVLNSSLFSLTDKIALANGLQENNPTPLILQSIRALSVDAHDPELRVICLRILGRGGDTALVLELINLPNLTAVDVAVCMSYSGQQFQTFASRVFERVMQQEIDARALSGFEARQGTRTDAPARFFALQPLLIKIFERMPEATLYVCSLIEGYVRFAVYDPQKWPGLFELAEKVMASEDERARRYMVYACTGTDRKAVTTEGLYLRTQIVQVIIERELDVDNIELLLAKLLSVHVDNPDVPSWLAQMMRKHPGLLFQKIFERAELWGADVPKAVQVLDCARAIADCEDA